MSASVTVGDVSHHLGCARHARRRSAGRGGRVWAPLRDPNPAPKCRSPWIRANPSRRGRSRQAVALGAEGAKGARGLHESSRQPRPAQARTNTKGIGRSQRPWPRRRPSAHGWSCEPLDASVLARNKHEHSAPATSVENLTDVASEVEARPLARLQVDGEGGAPATLIGVYGVTAYAVFQRTFFCSALTDSEFGRITVGMGLKAN